MQLGVLPGRMEFPRMARNSLVIFWLSPLCAWVCLLSSATATLATWGIWSPYSWKLQIGGFNVISCFAFISAPVSAAWPFPANILERVNDTLSHQAHGLMKPPFLTVSHFAFLYNTINQDTDSLLITFWGWCTVVILPRPQPIQLSQFVTQGLVVL